MLRRRFLQTAAALIASPAIVRGETSQILRFVPPSDLATLDPVWTTNYQTLYHAFLVFDTLFGLDSQFQPQPQMAEGGATEDGGKTWRITLREGLTLLSRDCAASIRRWGARESFGQTMLAATNEISAPDDRTILIRLRRPFPLLPSALGKMTPNICPIMPERLATTDPHKQVSEMVGSGPYRFKADERVHGAKLVYVRNDKYVPRADGLAEGTAGPKVAHFDRIEWHIISDPGTAAAALQQGEIDWLQSPSVDLLPQLRKNERLKVEILNPLGSIATLRLNHLNPPFDNPAMRRALLGAVDQSDHAIAAAGTDTNSWRNDVGYFCPGTPMASNAGMEALNGKRDLNSAKRAIDVAGYKGEKMVVLLPTNDPILNALADVTIDMLKKLDLNVDAQAMDWPTVMQRRTQTEPVERGGWSLFDTAWPGQDMLIPIGHVYLRGNGKAAAAGWPDSPKIETLCGEWLNAPDIATQKTIAEKIQLQAFEDVPYIPLCQYFPSVAYQANLTGVLRRIPVFWNMRRT